MKRQEDEDEDNAERIRECAGGTTVRARSEISSMAGMKRRLDSSDGHEPPLYCSSPKSLMMESCPIAETMRIGGWMDVKGEEGPLISSHRISRAYIHAWRLLQSGTVPTGSAMPAPGRFARTSLP